MPKVRLDSRTVGATMRESAETRSRVERWDTTCKSLCLRVEPSGRGAFYFRYRPRTGPNAGRQRRHKLGTYGALTVHEARKAATQLRAQADAGLDPAAERAATPVAPTVAEAAEQYMSGHVRVHCKPRTVRTYQDLFELHICPALGCRKVASIGRSDVERMHQGIAKAREPGERKGGKGAANRALALLRALLNAAEVRGSGRRTPTRAPGFDGSASEIPSNPRASWMLRSGLGSSPYSSRARTRRRARRSMHARAQSVRSGCCR